MDRRKLVGEREAGVAAQQLIGNITLEGALHEMEQDLYKELVAPGTDLDRMVGIRSEVLAIDRLRQKLKTIARRGSLAADKLKEDD